jgi:hypothetical protein
MIRRVICRGKKYFFNLKYNLYQDYKLIYLLKEENAKDVVHLKNEDVKNDYLFKKYVLINFLINIFFRMNQVVN